MEQPKTNRVIGNGVRQTPNVERSNMICSIFSSKTFKLGDVGRELGQHSRPTSVIMEGKLEIRQKSPGKLQRWYERRRLDQHTTYKLRQ